MQTDDALAETLATVAGLVLLEVRKDYADPIEDGDRIANEMILEGLARDRPDDAVLSEESEDDPARLSSDRVWIIDPLDGTREFREPGRPDWAVHVALWDRSKGQGGELTAGAVALPAQEVVLGTGAPPSLPPYDGPLRLVVSRTRPPAVATALAEALDAITIPMGSAGAKAMAVVRGCADVYLHAGGIYEWDTAAPVVVARAAGLHTSRLDGSPLTYNQPDPLQSDLLVCRPELADTVLEAIRGVS